MDAKARIARGARFYIVPIEGGYDICLAEAMQNKKAPILMVTDKAKQGFGLALSIRSPRL